MDEYPIARMVLMAEVTGGWVKGRLRLGWMNNVNVALCSRGMKVDFARKIVKSGDQILCICR